MKERFIARNKQKGAFTVNERKLFLALYLSNSDLPIPDIAEEVGYSSVSFFYKKFNEVFFQTPKEYRDNKTIVNVNQMTL